MAYSDAAGLNRGTAVGLGGGAGAALGATTGGFLTGASGILGANKHLRKLETSRPDAPASQRTRSPFNNTFA
jgi:hypothetical protein